MKEAISNSIIMSIVIIFIGVLVIILASSSTYTKAAKVRNRLIEMIESNQGYISDGITSPDVFRAEIESELAKYGYRINTESTNKCKPREGNSETAMNDIEAINTEYSKYKYCIYKYETNRGVYYGVETYMYFDIPLVDNLVLGIYGETKTLYDLSNF